MASEPLIDPTSPNPNWFQKLWEQILDKAADNASSIIVGLILAIASPAIAYLLGQDLIAQFQTCATGCRLSAVDLQLHLLAVFACGLLVSVSIMGVIIWRLRWSGRRHSEYLYAKKVWRVIDRLAQRQVTDYHVAVTFTANQTPQHWEVEETVRCVSQSGLLDEMASYAAYAGGMESIEILPLSAHGSQTDISIENLRQVDQYRYEYLIRFLPPIQPDATRRFRYQIKPTNPGPARPYIFTDSQYNAQYNGEKATYSTDSFEVAFNPGCLPKHNLVRKVYWPNGIGAEWTKYVEISAAEVAAAQDWRLGFEFTEDEIKRLDEKYSADLAHRYYGIAWEWPDLPSEDEVRANTLRETVQRVFQIR
ncbi:MAG TPA: hypothetical protein VI322_04570 [Candidatus Saccharimonadia bacterium]